MKKSSIKFIVAAIIIVGAVAWLAISGARDSKSYYVTITELQAMGKGAYSKNLRVAGNVAPGSIHRTGADADFTLLEQGKTLQVVYKGSEPPPDTFKDDAQALAIPAEDAYRVVRLLDLAQQSSDQQRTLPVTFEL